MNNIELETIKKYSRCIFCGSNNRFVGKQINLDKKIQKEYHISFNHRTNSIIIRGVGIFSFSENKDDYGFIPNNNLFNSFSLYFDIDCTSCENKKVSYQSNIVYMDKDKIYSNSKDFISKKRIDIIEEDTTYTYIAYFDYKKTLLFSKNRNHSSMILESEIPSIVEIDNQSPQEILTTIKGVLVLS